jgi:hypothetical protein
VSHRKAACLLPPAIWPITYLVLQVSKCPLQRVLKISTKSSSEVVAGKHNLWQHDCQAWASGGYSGARQKHIDHASSDRMANNEGWRIDVGATPFEGHNPGRISPSRTPHWAYFSPRKEFLSPSYSVAYKSRSYKWIILLKTIMPFILTPVIIHLWLDWIVYNQDSMVRQGLDIFIHGLPSGCI